MASGKWLVNTPGRCVESHCCAIESESIRTTSQRLSSEAKSPGLADDFEIQHMIYSEGILDCGQMSEYPGKMASYTSASFRTYRLKSSFFTALVFLCLSLLLGQASAVFIKYDNCLSQNVQNSVLLQFRPNTLDAVFSTDSASYNLNLTVWGNVTGQFTQTPPDYNNPNDTNGKILDIPFPDETQPKQTTLFNKVEFLTYEPWNTRVAFCGSLINGSCPLGPVFHPKGLAPYFYPSFSMSHDFYAPYSFATFRATFLIVYGDPNETAIGCISASITPDLGETISTLLTYLPLVVLVMVGVATVFAAVYCPWGTTDIFRWSTNYGRDADLLRLVTPGFGDCLQYLQFIFLSGSLSLAYPGFYQPVVSKAAWTSLMFNQSFIGSEVSSNPLVDGIYVANAHYGLQTMGQLVGLGQVIDIWTSMVVWLLIILGAVIVLIQAGFALRWVNRRISNTREEDLRDKNMPFTIGNVIRIVFSYLLLPIVALSMFQLVVASASPVYTVILVVVLLILIVGFAIWLLYLIISTRPRSFLFDDLPTVLLYGSLYNTYSDNAAPFALVPMFLTFLRGIAIGAVQPSGIAQLVLLAICEVIFILSLHSFRPFHSPTSMNVVHTFFAVSRLLSVMLMVAFAPSLGVTEGPKGWIGYAILVLHGSILVFGFFLNACQTIIEVTARLAGAGGDRSGAARGGLVEVFGMRQLSRRLPRENAGSRQSQLSSAAMLTEADRKSAYMMNNNTGNIARARSQSAGSTGILLNRQSMGFETASNDPSGSVQQQQYGGVYTPTSPGENSGFSFFPNPATGGPARNRDSSAGVAVGGAEANDPYYRPPRVRRTTVNALSSPGTKGRESWMESESSNKRWSEPENAQDEQVDPFEEPSVSGMVTPNTSYNGNEMSPTAADGEDNRRSKTDYTTREVDFYYNIRGPALNANTPGRKLRTGPVDPTGPAASAVGWFQRFMGGKTKDKGKGFEVVRSSRMPPAVKAGNRDGVETPPEGISAVVDTVRNGPIESDEDEPSPSKRAKAAAKAAEKGKATRSDIAAEDIDADDDSEKSYHDDEDEIPTIARTSDIPPSLPTLNLGDDIELPSRLPSKSSGKVTRSPSVRSGPAVPRRSSKRRSLAPVKQSYDGQGLSIIDASPPMSSPQPAFYDPQPLPQPASESEAASEPPRLPFERSNSNKRFSAMSTDTSFGGLDASGDASGDTTLVPLEAAEERPASVGYVSHRHVATRQDSGMNPAGSAAEVRRSSESPK